MKIYDLYRHPTYGWMYGWSKYIFTFGNINIYTLVLVWCRKSLGIIEKLIIETWPEIHRIITHIRKKNAFVMYILAYVWFLNCDIYFFVAEHSQRWRKILSHTLKWQPQIFLIQLRDAQIVQSVGDLGNGIATRVMYPLRRSPIEFQKLRYWIFQKVVSN